MADGTLRRQLGDGNGRSGGGGGVVVAPLPLRLRGTKPNYLVLCAVERIEKKLRISLIKFKAASVVNNQMSNLVCASHSLSRRNCMGVSAAPSRVVDEALHGAAAIFAVDKG